MTAAVRAYMYQRIVEVILGGGGIDDPRPGIRVIVHFEAALEVGVDSAVGVDEMKCGGGVQWYSCGRQHCSARARWIRHPIPDANARCVCLHVAVYAKTPGGQLHRSGATWRSRTVEGDGVRQGQLETG